MALNEETMAKLLQAQLAPVTTQLSALSESQNKLAEAFTNMQQAVANNTQQISDTSKTVTTLAANYQQLEAKQRQTEEQVLNMKKTMEELKHTFERNPKQVRVDLAQPANGSSAAASGTAPSPSPAPTATRQRPTNLEVRGFARTHYQADYADYYDNHLKKLLPDSLLDDCTPVYPHCQRHFVLRFTTNDNAFKAKNLLSTLPGYTDDRRQKNDKIYVAFVKTVQEKDDGRYRSHFYSAMQSLIEKLPIAKDKEVKMKMVTQNLVADIGGEPYETLRLASTRDGTIRITPFYESCLDLGIEKETVDKLVADATAKAEEAKSARSSR